MMKKRIGTGLTALLVAGVAVATNTNQNSSSSSRSLPSSMLKAMDQSKEVNKLSKQIAKEKDPVKREGKGVSEHIRTFMTGLADFDVFPFLAWEGNHGLNMRERPIT